VNGQNVVGLNDKEVSEIIDSAGNVVTVTVVPSYVYRHMMKNMSSSLIKKMMDHSVPDM
jgi:syntenin-1